MTKIFGRQTPSRQSACRECCKSWDLGPAIAGKAKSFEYFLFDGPVYLALRPKLWEKLTLDADLAAKCQMSEANLIREAA